MNALRSSGKKISQLSAFACLAVVVGCSSSSSPTASQVFSLSSVNDRLPAILSQDIGSTLEIRSGDITLEAEGRFTSRAMLHITRGGKTSDSVVVSHGTYQFVEERLELRSESGETLTLTRTDDTLQYISLGKVFKYVRATFQQ